LARKAAFARPEPGFSLYEGRTRGKKLKYTYSDDEDIFSDGLPAPRRSGRNTSGLSTPAEPVGPRFTASGRQIRSRAGGLYGESLLAGQREDEFLGDDDGSNRRQRTRGTRANGYTDYDLEDDEASNEGQSSGNEWQGGDEEDDNEFEGDDEEELSGDESVANGEPPSLVVQLRYGRKGEPTEGEEQRADPSHAAANKAESVTGPPAVRPQPLSVNGLLNAPQESPADSGPKATPVQAPAEPAAPAPSEDAVYSANGTAPFVPTPPQQFGGAV